MTNLSDLGSSTCWRIHPKDADPLETREWLDAFGALVEAEARERATYLSRWLLDHPELGTGSWRGTVQMHAMSNTAGLSGCRWGRSSADVSMGRRSVLPCSVATRDLPLCQQSASMSPSGAASQSD